MERQRTDEEAEIEELRSKAQLKEDLNREKSDFRENTSSQASLANSNDLGIDVGNSHLSDWLEKLSLSSSQVGLVDSDTIDETTKHPAETKVTLSSENVN